MARVESFGFIINSDCSRGCTDCFFDYEGKIDLVDFKKILEQIADFVKRYPKEFNDSIQLVGREPLFYEHDGKNLGDIVDAIHGHGLRLAILTRGFSNEEKQNSSLPYLNFMEFLKRFLSSYKPVTAVSFDTFNNNPELAAEMARNAIEGFLSIDSLGPTIYATTSIERAGKTYRALVDLMGSLSYNSHICTIEEPITIIPDIFAQMLADPFPERPGPRALFGKNNVSDENAGRIIISAYQNVNKKARLARPTITFYSEGKRDIKAEICDYDRAGKGADLKETPMSSISHCSALANEFSLVIRPDLTVVPCQSSYCLEIPPISSLKEKSLDNLLSIYVNHYRRALVGRQKLIEQRDSKQGSGVCSTCADALPFYLNRFQPRGRRR